MSKQFKIWMAVIMLGFAYIAYSHTLSTVVSRLELTHPDLGYDGGAGLHTLVRNAWTKMGDNMNSRLLTYIAGGGLADAASIDLKHNFYADFADMSFVLYEYDDGTGELVSKLTSGFTIVAKTGDEKRQVTVTNVAGGAGTTKIALLAVHNGGAGAGGGGGSLSWDEPPGTAPVKTSENGQDVYLFESGSSNSLVSFIKIPAGHLAANQISMAIGLYSPSASNTILLTTTTTLIRTGTDAVSSTTNQHVSTNSALTNTVADLFVTDSLDLTDGSGQINGVDAEPGDLIKVEISRGTDTDTADIRFVPNATEVSF